MITKSARTIGSAVGTLREAVAEGLKAAGVSAKYDAGSKRSRLKNWRGSDASINTETRRSLQTIRKRSRDLVANHWAAGRAKSVIQKNVIGSGIRPTSQNPEMEELLKALCNGTELDPRRRKTMYSIQGLVMGAIPESGEVLVIRQRRSRAEMERHGLTLPLQIQVMEADHIDILKDGVGPNGNVIKQGIEFDSTGAIVAYHLLDKHPGDTFAWQRQSFESQRVLASDVCHPFEEWRPGQIRGLPWGISAMVKMNDLSDYEGAQLLKQKIAAAFAGFIYHDDRVDLDKLYDPEGVPTSLQPGTMEYLRPGESVEFSNPPKVEGMADFSRITTRAIAAAYNVTYEALTQDMSNVNFSSGRMGWLEMQRHIETWQREIMIAQVCLRFEEWIKEAAAMVGIVDDTRWKWTPPRREMIDPVKESAAAIAMVRSGLSDRDDEIQKLGKNGDDVDNAQARANARADALGLVHDSDPRKLTQQGQAHTTPPDDIEATANAIRASHPSLYQALIESYEEEK